MEKAKISTEFELELKIICLLSGYVTRVAECKSDAEVVTFTSKITRKILSLFPKPDDKVCEWVHKGGSHFVTGCNGGDMIFDYEMDYPYCPYCKGKIVIKGE